MVSDPVTQEDLARIYTILDSLSAQVGNVALAQAQTATILSGLKDALDAQSRDRSLTCPTRPDMNRMLAVAYAIGGKQDPVSGATELVNRMNTMWSLGKWVGGIMAVTIVVPGVAWLARWVVQIVAVAIAGQ